MLHYIQGKTCLAAESRLFMLAVKTNTNVYIIIWFMKDLSHVVRIFWFTRISQQWFYRRTCVFWFWCWVEILHLLQYIRLCSYVLDIRYISHVKVKLTNFLNRETYDGKSHLSFWCIYFNYTMCLTLAFRSFLLFSLIIQVFPVMLDSSLQKSTIVLLALIFLCF